MRSDGLHHLLAPSIISICIYAVCLCSTSWAWFTAAQTSHVAEIQTAAYTVNVTAAVEEIPTEVTGDNSIYTMALEADNTYEITITANGTATNGYCTVTLGDQTYYTPQIEKDTDFTFEILAYQSGDLTISPQWGTCAASEPIIDSENPLEFGTKPDNSELDPLPVTDMPEIFVPETDDIVVPADPTQDDDHPTTPTTENTQPDTTLPEDTPEPPLKEATISIPEPNTDTAETTEADNITE